MQFTVEHIDALAELINIGHGRAAAALSQMTGHRIRLAVPTVRVLPIAELGTELSQRLPQPAVCVNQAFTGPLSGNAMLLLDHGSATSLSTLLDENGTSGVFGEFPHEIITEAGNILLNACLGAFGNLLEIQLTFTVPTVEIDTIPAVLRSITVRGERLTHGIVAETHFSIHDSHLEGMLAIILGITSLTCLVEGLDRWQRR